MRQTPLRERLRLVVPLSDKLSWRNPWLWACVAAQAATVAVTWELWQVRTDPPNLPLIEALARLPWGWILLASLALVVVSPRIGVPLHLVALGLAICGDQFRLQPQFILLGVLMWGCISEAGGRVCRWMLIAMWFWAGLHKMLSLDWWGHRSWSLVAQTGLDPENLYIGFAAMAIGAELVTAGLAVWKPRWGAVSCAVMHVAIAVFLSPLGADRNVSVIPWNLFLAGFGAKLLWQAESDWPRVKSWERIVAAILLVYPVGFYSGWIDRALCHVLYSDNLPQGVITRIEGAAPITGWGKLRVPFPSQQRLLRQFFESVAEPGDKLHVWEPRWGLRDRFFVIASPGKSREIDADEFYDQQMPGTVLGIGLDDPRAVFALARDRVRLLKRDHSSMVYAAEIPPEVFRSRQLLWLARLPNLVQLQLRGCAVDDRHLPLLMQLRSLIGIGIEGTKLSEAATERLRSLPRLTAVEQDESGQAGEFQRENE